MFGIPVSQLYEEQKNALNLTLLGGKSGFKRLLPSQEINRPGLALAGFFEVFSHNRIQVMGNTEISYLKSLTPRERRLRLQRVFEFPIPCIFITNDLDPPGPLEELAEKKNVPLFKTPFPTSMFAAKINFYLEGEFAPTTVVHASLLDVFGQGVLIMGESGSGKSEAALELIERGHRFIADDSVLLKRVGRHLLIGSMGTGGPHHMEVRGIGLVDIEKLFGIGSVREEKRVSLVVSLARSEGPGEGDRTGLEENKVSFLEVELPLYLLTVMPGRNISLLIEVAALTQRLRDLGQNPAEEINRRMILAMQQKTEVRRVGNLQSRKPKSSPQGGMMD